MTVFEQNIRELKTQTDPNIAVTNQDQKKSVLAHVLRTNYLKIPEVKRKNGKMEKWTICCVNLVRVMLCRILLQVQIPCTVAEKVDSAWLCYHLRYLHRVRKNVSLSISTQM